MANKHMKKTPTQPQSRKCKAKQQGEPFFSVKLMATRMGGVGGNVAGRRRALRSKLTFQMCLSSFLAIPWLGVERDLPSTSNRDKERSTWMAMARSRENPRQGRTK